MMLREKPLAEVKNASKFFTFTTVLIIIPYIFTMYLVDYQLYDFLSHYIPFL